METCSSATWSSGPSSRCPSSSLRYLAHWLDPRYLALRCRPTAKVLAQPSQPRSLLFRRGSSGWSLGGSPRKQAGAVWAQEAARIGALLQVFPGDSDPAAQDRVFVREAGKSWSLKQESQTGADPERRRDSPRFCGSSKQHAPPPPGSPPATQHRAFSGTPIQEAGFSDASPNKKSCPDHAAGAYHNGPRFRGEPHSQPSTRSSGRPTTARRFPRSLPRMWRRGRSGVLLHAFLVDAVRDFRRSRACRNKS